MNRGFTLFMAIIVAGTVLLIAAGVTSLATRQSLISSTGRESQYAFYAADTGLECALYWDVKNPSGYSAFSTSTGSQILNACNGETINVGGSYISNFDLTDPYCVKVRVEKFDNGTTIIESRGYNTCDTLNLRRVERAVRASY